MFSMMSIFFWNEYLHIIKLNLPENMSFIIKEYISSLEQRAFMFSSPKQKLSRAFVIVICSASIVRLYVHRQSFFKRLLFWNHRVEFDDFFPNVPGIKATKIVQIDLLHWTSWSEKMKCLKILYKCKA